MQRSIVQSADALLSKKKSIAEYLIDERDGQKYRTVVIGTQTWMAENLNYAIEKEELDFFSFCYNNVSDSCAKYGWLYTWNAALGVCPEGWHLPNDSEWNILFNAVGGNFLAGRALKSKSEWSDDGDENDAFGFSALPAGYGTLLDIHIDLPYHLSSNRIVPLCDLSGCLTRFWSSSETDSELTYVEIRSEYDNVNDSTVHEDDILSVRCVKDVE